MPCPHFDVKIIQRSKRQSAVASAAYQSGERLFSEYDQKQKYYSHKSEIVHTEIMLPPHAPPEYADRNTLWNAAEAIEKQWNSQLARRFVLAIPRELPRSQYADLIRDYCREFFVSKGMIADFAIQMKQNRIFDQNSSQKARSWHYNMDTNRAEAQFADGSAIAIDCLAIEDEYGNTPAQRAELDWLLYNKPLECVQLVLSGEIEHYLSLGCDHGKLKD